MLFCNNESPTGEEFHLHSTPEEALKCWGTTALYVVGGDLPATIVPLVTTAPSPAALPAWVPPVAPIPKPRWWDDPVTDSQLWRVGKEGGSKKFARTLVKGQCIAYIDALQHGKAPKLAESEEDDEETPPTPMPVSPPAPTRRGTLVHGYIVAKDSTFVLTPLLDRVPDGRYALQMADEEPTFLRVVRPARGKWAGCLKVQTQHGERYEEAWCLWDDGRVGVFKVSVEDYINLLISDYRGAARLYAKIKTRCARCNTELTDERSRHYGIGPECEKYWSWMIDQVDEETALLRGDA